MGYDDDMVLDLGFSSPTEIPIAQLCLTCRHAGSIANFGDFGNKPKGHWLGGIGRGCKHTWVTLLSCLVGQVVGLIARVRRRVCV